MAVVTAVLGTVESLHGRFESEDPVLLNSEERASAHLVGRSEGGRDVRISLPRGTEINDGDVLSLDGATAVVARAAPEALYVVSPDDATPGASRAISSAICTGPCASPMTAC